MDNNSDFLSQIYDQIFLCEYHENAEIGWIIRILVYIFDNKTIDANYPKEILFIYLFR